MQNAIQPLVHMLMSTLLWVVPLMVVAALLGSPWGKGHVGEWFVRFMLRWQLDKAVYFPLHNVTLATPDGSTQIDHVIVMHIDDACVHRLLGVELSQYRVAGEECTAGTKPHAAADGGLDDSRVHGFLRGLTRHPAGAELPARLRRGF